MRLYLDESVSVALAAVLLQHGVDCLTARDAGSLGTDDESQLLFATQQSRIILTHDTRDFLHLASMWAASGRSHAGIFLVQVLILQFSTPLYDLDTNSFIRGGLTWDIYHNPFENIFLAAVIRISHNPDFTVMFQVLFFSFSVSLLAHILFPGKFFLWIALIAAALEPVSLFYNFSFLPESFYTSFTLLYCSFLILYCRKAETFSAFLFGTAIGLAFLCKLSAMTQICLFAVILIQNQSTVIEKIKHFATALIPFIACYLFVWIGQHSINDAGLYVVSGRVRWDYANSQYAPQEIEAETFKRFVHPHFLKDGEIPESRELRRELSFVGYKDCVEENRRNTQTENDAICFCDSIFGDAGTQILNKHSSAARFQFIKDNLSAIHTLNYLDYRFTPGLPFYHTKAEYEYLDSLMKSQYGFSLDVEQEKILPVWKNLGFSNVYIPILWWSTWVILLLTAGKILTKAKTQIKNSKQLFADELTDPVSLVFSITLSIPWIFHLVYISYRPRFLAPYFVIAIFFGLFILSQMVMNKKQDDDLNIPKS